MKSQNFGTVSHAIAVLSMPDSGLTRYGVEEEGASKYGGGGVLHHKACNGFISFKINIIYETRVAKSVALCVA